MFTITGIISIIITSLLNAILGFVVFMRNPKSDLNKVFLGLSLAIAFWAATSLTSDSTSDYELSKITSSLAFSFGFIGIFFVWLFTTILSKKKPKYLFWYYFVPSVAISVLSATPLVYKLTTIDKFENGILYYPYLIAFIVLMLASFYNLLSVFKRGNRSERSQIRYILIGIIILTVGGGLFNAILPVNFPEHAEVLTKIGPLFSVFFIGMTGLAIVRHKLFDFRAVLARSLTYLFTTFFVVAGYVAVAFFVTHFLVPDTKIETAQFISNILLTVVLVLTFPLIKRRFDRVTNKIFFRDAYDPQALIGKINQTLVTNVQLESLLTKSALVIQENIKNDFCMFYIRETSYLPSRIFGAHRINPEIESIDDLETHASKIHHRVYSAVNDTENDNEINLSKILKKNQIEVMARLVTTLDYDVKGIGYIFMGQKKSGSLYTTQDLKIIEIIANELVIAIENVLRFEEIEQFNITLQKKIDGATKELKKSNEKLKALDEAKDEFISMASHQLRTPLTSVKGYLSMLAEGDAGKLNDTQNKFIDQAFVSSQRMVYLIADLLNVSRLKTGKFIIEPKPMYLPDVVESEISQLYQTVKARGIKMTFNKPKTFPIVNLDEVKLRQVIMNFTDNAIYYTPATGSIVLELKNVGDSVEFTVTDTGMGVPKNEQQHLFTKFYRAGNARKARPDGTGLGLFMAKKVIVASGGSLIFNSIEGKGSTFGFKFNTPTK
ncbi:MAG: ATP-binding protein [bacterium]